MAGETILKKLRFSVGDRFFVEANEARGYGRADTRCTSSPPQPLCYLSFFPLPLHSLFREQAEAVATTLGIKATPTALSTWFVSVASTLGWLGTSNPNPHFWKIIKLVESRNRCQNGGGHFRAEFIDGICQYRCATLLS